MRINKNSKLIALLFIFFTCSQDSRFNDYRVRMGFPLLYDSYIIVLDYGCHTCKDRFYDYAVSHLPDSTALIFKRKPEQETIKAYPDLFKKSYVFIDSLDISFEVGLTKKNSEITLIRKNKINHFNFIEYESLISELEKE